MTKKNYLAQMRAVDVARASQKKIVATLRIDYVREPQPQIATKKLRLRDREMEKYRRICKEQIQLVKWLFDLPTFA